MTDTSKPDDDAAVGYGRPPKHSRFQKGRSSNPKGRPKTRGAVRIDLDRLLGETVTVVQDGVARAMSVKEVELRRILKKALTQGDLKAIAYLLDQFDKHGVIEKPEPEVSGGVLRLPSTMPWAMAQMMAYRHGAPPWTKRQIETMRAEYEAGRSEEDRLVDEAMGY